MYLTGRSYRFVNAENRRAKHMPISGIFVQGFKKQEKKYCRSAWKKSACPRHI
jgi:hypothetical protein